MDKHWDNEYRDGGSISSDRRFTEWDFNKLMASDKFRAVWSGNLWEIIEEGRTRVLGKFNPKTKSLYISGDKNMDNFLVVWMTENGFVNSDEYAILANGGGVERIDLFDKDELINLIKTYDFKSVDVSNMETISYSKSENPFDKFDVGTIKLSPLVRDYNDSLLIVIDKQKGKYIIRIGRDTGWTGGLEQSSVELTFDIPKLTFEEFKKGFLNATINQNYCLVSKYGTGNIDTIHFQGNLQEIKDYALENGYELKESNGIFDFYFYKKDFPSWRNDKLLQVYVLSSQQIDNITERNEGSRYANGGGIGNDWFWNYAYRHYLRDASLEQRNKVKKQFIKEGLDLEGESPRHSAIISSIVGEYANGGGVERIDLFEDYENIPERVKIVLDTYQDAFENGDYKQLAIANRTLERIGYTFDYGLDGQAYGLRPISVPLNELKGYEDMGEEYANGGAIKTDFNELENTELRNVLISFWNDFFNSNIGNYLSIEKENYILSNINNVFVIVRDEDKGNFSDVEKQNIDMFLSPYFDSDKKPLFTEFFNKYEIKDNKIIIYIKDMYANGGGVGKSKSFLHLYKLTYPNGQYRVESYDGEYMTPKEALEKMRITLRGYKSYQYSGASSDSENYKKWYDKKDIGYSDTEAWDEVFGSQKYAKGGGVRKINTYKDWIRDNPEWSKFAISEYKGWIFETTKGRDVTFKATLIYKGNRRYIYVWNNEEFVLSQKLTPETADRIIDLIITKKNKYDNGGGVDYDTRWAEMEVYSPYTSRAEYENKKEYEDLAFASKTFSKTSEMLVRENLNNGEICMCKLTKILGHEPNYPTQIVGSLKLEKCFMKRFYKLA